METYILELFRSAETSTFIGTRESAGSIDLALRRGQSAVRNMTRCLITSPTILEHKSPVPQFGKNPNICEI